MKFKCAIAATMMCANLSWGQSVPAKGAKALFYDVTSQVSAPGGTEATTRRVAIPSTPKNGPVRQEAAPNTGLMYYVELIKPNQELQRVNATRIFRSGEKIRLHFQSNVDGRLVILQKQSGGTAQKLFPAPRVNGGDNRIRAGTETIIPSEKAWLTFDNKPGEERLMVFLTPESGFQEIQSDVASTLDGERTDRLEVLISQRRTGSKALVLEVDDKSDRPAVYAVASQPQPASKAGVNLTSDIVALEIVLNHQQ